MTALIVLAGTMNGAAFQAYVGRVLVATLSTGDTIVMDDLPTHKSAVKGTIIEAADTRLL